MADKAANTYSGVIVGGGRRAAALGFPTANIALRDGEVLSGVYAVAALLDGKEYRAVAYADARRHLLEVHLLDVEMDLYGKQLFVTLLQKLRDDRAFDGEDAAREQIRQDVEAAREYFAQK